MTTNTLSTTKCSSYGHPEFILIYEVSVPQADIAVLASFLEDSVAEGIRYNDGDLITMGSMLLRVARVNEGLVLNEPNLRSIPIEWRQGVTETLRLLRLQKDIVESVGLEDEFDPPSVRCSLVMGVDVTQIDAELFLDRVTAIDTDSGWFVGRQDSRIRYEDEVNWTRISVYQAILSWPVIAGFLALPRGCRVVILGGRILFTRNGKSLEIRSGSLLANLVGVKPN